MKNWKRYVVLLLLTGFLMDCQKPNSNMIQRLDGTSIAADTLTEKVQSLIDQAQIHGLSLSVFNDGALAYHHFFGYKNYDEKSSFNDTTNIYGASLSKAVFSVLIMRLVEEGVLDLDKPLQDYLPKPIYEYEPKTRWHDNYNDLREDSLYTDITARMCLSHTSGFPNWRFIEADKKLRCKFPPGTQFWYSGEGFVYLQVVLEKMLDTNLEDLAQKYVFQPLGMENSGYEWQSRWENDFASGHSFQDQVLQKDTDNEARGGSTLETTVADYHRFLTAALQGDLIKKESWDLIFEPQIRLKGKRQFGPLVLEETNENDEIELSYGLGWILLQTPYGLGAYKEGNGSGFQHHSLIIPEAGIGILILGNSQRANGIFKALLELSIADVYTPWRWENYIPFDQKEMEE